MLIIYMKNTIYLPVHVQQTRHKTHLDTVYTYGEYIYYNKSISQTMNKHTVLFLYTVSSYTLLSFYWCKFIIYTTRTPWKIYIQQSNSTYSLPSFHFSCEIIFQQYFVSDHRVRPRFRPRFRHSPEELMVASLLQQFY